MRFEVIPSDYREEQDNACNHRNVRGAFKHINDRF
jgi:hypothetical protein